MAEATCRREYDYNGGVYTITDLNSDESCVCRVADLPAPTGDSYKSMDYIGQRVFMDGINRRVGDRFNTYKGEDLTPIGACRSTWQNLMDGVWGEGGGGAALAPWEHVAREFILRDSLPLLVPTNFKNKTALNKAIVEDGRAVFMAACKAAGLNTKDSEPEYAAIIEESKVEATRRATSRKSGLVGKLKAKADTAANAAAADKAKADKGKSNKG